MAVYLGNGIRKADVYKTLFTGRYIPVLYISDGLMYYNPRLFKMIINRLEHVKIEEIHLISINLTQYTKDELVDIFNRLSNINIKNVNICGPSIHPNRDIVMKLLKSLSRFEKLVTDPYNLAIDGLHISHVKLCICQFDENALRAFRAVYLNRNITRLTIIDDDTINDYNWWYLYISTIIREIPNHISYLKLYYQTIKKYIKNDSNMLKELRITTLAISSRTFMVISSSLIDRLAQLLKANKYISQVLIYGKSILTHNYLYRPDYDYTSSSCTKNNILIGGLDDPRAGIIKIRKRLSRNAKYLEDTKLWYNETRDYIMTNIYTSGGSPHLISSHRYILLNIIEKLDHSVQSGWRVGF